jgi:hypothetical protein
MSNAYREKLLSLNIAPSATGSAQAQAGNDLTDRWNHDLPALARLAKAGITPPSSDGAAIYERAVDSHA